MAIFLIVLLLLGFTCMEPVTTALQRPHIVFMIADDLGWNDVSFHGSMQIPTPNIDAIARDGIILNQYYVQPSCSPSRGCLMTGKYAIKIGFQHDVIRNGAPWGLPLYEKIIPQYLKSMKYKTHAVGKWHLGFYKDEYLPLKRGFDSFFGFYTGVEDYFTHVSIENESRGLDLHENYENVWRYNGTYGTDLFTAKAKEVIQEHNPNEPLFLYFAQQAPHCGNFIKPLQVPDNYVRPMVGIQDEIRRKYAGMVSALDYSVGEIIDSLEESGMLDNTIFIFTSDNGGVPREKEGTSSSNYPLKGGKYNLWEGGIRVVSFLWSPLLRHRSRIYSELMHISDWLPTILSAAGGPEALSMLPESIDGKDQWPSLTHFLPSPRSEILLNINDLKETEGIRKGRFKLVKGSYYSEYDKWYDPEGKVLNGAYSVQTPLQKIRYMQNYFETLKCSKAARILWKKYGRDPRLTFTCTSPDCKEQLEVKCGVLRPAIPTCDAEKEPCLFDIVRDPCEFYNIAKDLPWVTADLERTLEKYRAFAIPPEVKPIDLKSDPKLHGNVWVPWE